MHFPKIIPTKPPTSPSKISKETFKDSSVTGTLLNWRLNKENVMHFNDCLPHKCEPQTVVTVRLE